MKNLIITMILWAVCAAAQEPVKPKVPSIPAEHQAEYFRADGALVRASQIQKESQSDVQAAVDAMVKDCGPDYSPAPDGKRLICAPKPKEKK